MLLLDEPFAHLDALARNLLRQELLNLWERERKTVIFVSHDLEEAVLLSDRVGVMTLAPGRIKGIISVNLPRPRGLKSMGDPRYAEVYQKIWDLLEEERGLLAPPEERDKKRPLLNWW